MAVTLKKLAIDGGNPVIGDSAKPLAPPRWGEAEMQELAEALRQETLFYWRGQRTARCMTEFQRHYPLKHVMPCSSGTASIHIAMLAINLQPGDEIITTPITDQGTVIGLLYQQGVPVFADVDPATYNLDPADVERKITPRTRAIIAVHLAGNPCNLDALRQIADHHQLKLIEDCAQAWGARYRDRPVGTIGDAGCFSFNDFKHISTGDGGMIGTNDPAIGQLLQVSGDKGYDRLSGGKSPERLAPCYRISELQSAVATVQLQRIPAIAERRNRLGNLLTERLREVPGIRPHKVEAGGFCSYWFYMFCIDSARFSCSRDELVAAMNAEGLPAGAGYIPEPLYRYPVFQTQKFFGNGWPARDLGHTTMDYGKVTCPNAEQVLRTAIRLEIREWMTEDYIELVAEAVRKVALAYAL